MTQSTEDRVLRIKKLLNKAEAKGTTEAEREAFNAKAQQLMIEWGIEAAMLANADETKTERIVTMEVVNAAPKSYSYEMTHVGIAVAQGLGCQGLLQRKRDGRVNLLIVGYESDVQRVDMLFAALARQCAMELGIAYANSRRSYWTGTDRFRFRKSFIIGFAEGLDVKFRMAKKTVLQDASPGTDLVLVDRAQRVKDWIGDNMNVSASRNRNYVASGALQGRDAGLRADMGSGSVGGSRKGVEA